jgi:hypothetical protein
LSYYASQICRVMSMPNEENLLIAQNILKYARGSLDEKITFRPADANDPLGDFNYGLMTFSDSDWSTRVDTRNSHGCFIIMLSGLCARSWLARHPAKIEITRSSGGSSHSHQVFFFFKNHDFSRFLINFSTVVVVKHTHVVDPKRLTHIHSYRDLNSLSLSTDSTYLLVPMP